MVGERNVITAKLKQMVCEEVLYSLLSLKVVISISASAPSVSVAKYSYQDVPWLVPNLQRPAEASGCIYRLQKHLPCIMAFGYPKNTFLSGIRKS